MTRQADDPIYEKEYAADRIRAAAEAARALPFAFTLTARAENYLRWPRRSSPIPSSACKPTTGGRRGCALRAGPPQQKDSAITAVVSSVDRPVNVVVMGLQEISPSDTGGTFRAWSQTRRSVGKRRLPALRPEHFCSACARDAGERRVPGFTQDAVSYREINGKSSPGLMSSPGR